MDWQAEHEIDTALATLEIAVKEEVAIRSALNRKRSRCIDDIEALEATARQLDKHYIELPRATELRLSADRLWIFVTVIDDQLASSHEREASIRSKQSKILRSSKARKRH